MDDEYAYLGVKDPKARTKTTRNLGVCGLSNGKTFERI